VYQGTKELNKQKGTLPFQVYGLTGRKQQLLLRRKDSPDSVPFSTHITCIALTEEATAAWSVLKVQYCL
jgi:hypothetical protein